MYDSGKRVHDSTDYFVNNRMYTVGLISGIAVSVRYPTAYVLLNNNPRLLRVAGKRVMAATPPPLCLLWQARLPL